MRTTLRIDDDLMRELNEQARREGLSLTRLVNRVLRQGLKAASRPARPQTYREKAVSMGRPRVDLTRALALAASLEDGEIRQKLACRK